MSALSNLWSQLVQRRLLPVAILLIAALVAVPLVLANEPDPVPAPPPAQVDTSSELADDPIVTAVSAEQSSRRKKVLGAAKNPFAADNKPAAETTPEPTETGAAEESKPTTDDAPTGGFVPVPTTPVAPITPAEPEPAAEPEKKYEAGELTVRFDGKRRSVKKLDPLPSAEEPTLIYTGTIKDGKVAEFLVDASVSAIGDGECHPSPDACETLRLREGDIEFVDVKDEAGNVVAQYEIELVEIHKGKKSASRAKSARTVKAVSALRGGPATKASRSELRTVAGLAATRLP